MTAKYAIVSDFDGTITFEDFFWYVANKWLNQDALAPWQEYLLGTETHINALNRIFAKINVPQMELDYFIKSIPYDQNFVKAVECCHNKGIPFYICSAGCDYYINLLIGDIIKKNDIELITNHGVYNEISGLKMLPPSENSPYYDKNVGISKASIVKKLKDEGYTVIFAGDGPPDIAPARLADVVFAKKILLEKCREEGIITRPFINYEDICRLVKEI